MVHVKEFNTHIEDYEKWFSEHESVFLSELEAIRYHFLKLPENIRGIEVGLGTGRFSQPLGIKEGLEPSEAMGNIAIERGIEVIRGVAENLPYSDIQFDFVLFVTICHLEDIRAALKEANRVLKHSGTLIVGFLDKEQTVAQNYIKNKYGSTFYKHAKFYTVKYINELMVSSGFKNLEVTQTLFGKLEDIDTLQTHKKGFGEGSFVVISAKKH